MPFKWYLRIQSSWTSITDTNFAPSGAVTSKPLVGVSQARLSPQPWLVRPWAEHRHRWTTDMSFKTGVWQQLDDLANKLIMIFWTFIMVTLWSQRFSVTCNYSYSNQKTSNQQFHVACVSVLLVPLYGFDLLNTVGHCSTRRMPVQGAIAVPHPQSILANSWKIYSSFNFQWGSLLPKRFSRGCASCCQHIEMGNTPEGLRQKSCQEDKIAFHFLTQTAKQKVMVLWVFP